MTESIIGLFGNLVLPYFVLSLMAMVVVELIAEGIGLRARTLEQVIRNMLDDPRGCKLGDSFYQHPLIESLSVGRRKPAYIPGRIFALTLLDVLEHRAQTTATNVSAALPDNEKVDRALQTLLLESRPCRRLHMIEWWFDGVMDRASGLYRWRTLLILAGVATMFVVPFNFDAIRIGNHITHREIIERIVEKRIEARVASDSLRKTDRNPALVNETEASWIRGLVLPIGWPSEGSADSLGALLASSWDWLVMKTVGLLTSILAIMLGASFLFDLLNRFMVVRFTIKPWHRFNEMADKDE